MQNTVAVGENRLTGCFELAWRNSCTDFLNTYLVSSKALDDITLTNGYYESQYKSCNPHNSQKVKMQNVSVNRALQRTLLLNGWYGLPLHMKFPSLPPQTSRYGV